MYVFMYDIVDIMCVPVSIVMSIVIQLCVQMQFWDASRLRVLSSNDGSPGSVRLPLNRVTCAASVLKVIRVVNR